MKKRLFSLLMVLSLICTMLPTSAFAADVEYLDSVYITEHNPLYPHDSCSVEEYAPTVDALHPLQGSQYEDDLSVAAATIRTAMENRQSTVSVNVFLDGDTHDGSEASNKAMMRGIFHDAYAHTGNPTQGDYLKWVYNTMSAGASGYISWGDYYYTITYTITYYTTAAQEQAVTEKLAQVMPTFGFTSATTDYEKVKAVHDYICANVTYDHENLENESYKLKYTAYAALINGTSVCQGYATLLYRMLLMSGVDTRVVIGTAGGGNHGWNIVKLGDVYYNVDSTWDAGETEYDYFLTCPASFDPSHTRDAEYTTAAFHAAYPMASENYDPNRVPSFAGGTGTASDPYLISTKEHLNNVRNYLGAHFKMTNDIVFNDADFAEGGAFYNGGAGWEPIGDEAAPFTGVFDGGEYAIKNLYINIESDSDIYAGLFGYSTGTIQNLGMVDSDITASTINYTSYAGGIVGEVYYGGTVTNCYNTGSVNATASSYRAYAGGIAGYVFTLFGTVTNCYNTGNVSAAATASSSTAYAGGIAGYLHPDTVINCYNTGTVSGDNYAGGIAGYVSGGTVTNCYNTGAVSTDNNAGGGIAGSVSSSTVSNCYNTGTISKSYYAGGIAGYVSSGTVSNCYNTGSMTGSLAGGIAGCVHSGTVTNCYYLDTAAKGLGSGAGTTIKCTAAQLQQQSTFTSFDFTNTWTMAGNEDYPYPELTGLTHIAIPDNTTEFAGGNGSSYAPYLISTTAHLDNVRKYLGAHFKLTNDIVFTDADFADGGAFCNGGAGWEPIGNNYGNRFTGTFDGNGYVVKNLYVNVSTGLAGLFGFTGGTIQNLGMVDGDITASTASGDSYAGGIAGRIYTGGTVSNCYNTGNVSASAPTNAYAGGILGGTYYDSVSVSNCYNTGSIYASSDDVGYTGNDAYAGGIAGYSDTVTNCYNTGNINTYSDFNSYAGGIVGAGYTVSNCYNAGRVKSGAIFNDTEGGIAGKVSGTISNCYNFGATSDISSYIWTGGIAGSAGSVTNCYYLDVAEKGVGNGTDSAAKCTAAQLQQQSTFSGFDFTNVWTMGGSSAYPFPELKNVPLSAALPGLSACSITLDKSVLQYSMKQPVVTVTHNGKTLTLGKDYAAYYETGNNKWQARENQAQYITAIGNAKVTVVGMGDYAGAIDVPFTVTKFDMANAKLMTPWVSGSSGPFTLEDFVYDGTAKTQPEFRVVDACNTVSAEYYDITYKNNVEVGTATMVITGKGDFYTGTLEKTFRITDRAVREIVVTKTPDKVEYLTDDQSIDVTGGKITVYYQDGGSDTLPITSDMVAPVDFSTPGTRLVRVSYNGAFDYYSITIRGTTFADIPADSWQYPFAVYAVKNGLMAGKGTDADGNIKFDPNSPIKREEFVQVLYNAEGKPAISIANPFPDVADGGWYKNAVLWAKQNDIASGKGNGNFGVGENISRQDLAMMLYKYAKLNGYSLDATEGLIDQFADGANVASYARGAMDWAVTNGIMSGKGTAGADLSTFRLDPTGIATRAECAAMLKNFQTAFGG